MQTNNLKTRLIILLSLLLLVILTSVEFAMKTTNDSVLVEITVCKNGDILYDTTPVELKELEGLIKADLIKIPDIIFHVKRWKETPQGTFLGVLDQLKLAGAKKISVSKKL
ncbi:MAG: ExbD/TolR family protein [Calditrichia bacterium]